MEFLWIERFEKVAWINDDLVQVAMVTRADVRLVIQMKWETFDDACQKFATLNAAR